jgi:uncharacterized protein
VSNRSELLERGGATTDNVAVVRRMYDAFARGDVETIFALTDPQCVIEQSNQLPWGGRHVGHQGLGAFLGALSAHVESSVATDRYIDDGAGHVATSGVTRGRVRATGREFAIPETHIWTVRDGKVTRFEAYIDTAQMREALGL